jgi:NAD(P)H-hydrate epimerase
MTAARSWLSRSEVREVDRRAIEEYGLPGVVLMENAGRGCAELLLLEGCLVEGSRVIICCGKGNNGGDGFVIARHLEIRGMRAGVILTCEPSELRGDAAVHFRVIDRAGLPITIAASAEAWRDADRRLGEAAWLVDALLGTGFEGTPREPVASAIRAMNQSGRPILAIDLPSGLDADAGTAAGECVRAARTMTFVAKKRGFEVSDCREWTGPVDVIHIGVPKQLLTSFGLGQEFRVPPGTPFAYD